MGLRSQNNPIASFRDVFCDRKGCCNPTPVSSEVTATGGTLEPNGIDAPNGFTYHVFTDPGTFTVSDVTGTGDVSNLILLLLVEAVLVMSTRWWRWSRFSSS